MRLIDADKLKISYDGHFVGVAKNDLDNAPTVEAEPIIHGHWVETIYGDFMCSHCHMVNCAEGNFCSWCGAKMDVESE